ncbi:INO80 complex subunit C, variant 2 [Schistosoma haematobium]|uniref:INO80 complex subunit C, variant 2 n=1 Tax=Schistosoma haematobium TaxID=6185 RepID=A0A922ISA4_SCHHA|nr:INO80 complex subunit C, variant 2 [Schistosoma haematobium]KAH9585059.1 INO80 complex subunit C, variant 2 [Schistosoma haematobium]CAH8514727.1 unnamed protein product [Schistosoma haematobium]
MKGQTSRRNKKECTARHSRCYIEAYITRVSYSPDAVLYNHLNAPPCICPPMKVSDLSGIPTAYTDPLTKLNYATCSEFKRIRYLPQHIVNGYLALRGVSNI